MPTIERLKEIGLGGCIVFHDFHDEPPRPDVVRDSWNSIIRVLEAAKAASGSYTATDGIIMWSANMTLVMDELESALKELESK